jgi:hypothetical protein
MTTARKRLSHLRVAFLFVRQNACVSLGKHGKSLSLTTKAGCEMNEAKAIEYATVHSVTVSTDRKSGKGARAFAWFRAGGFVVRSIAGQQWRVIGDDGATFTGRRGQCIEFCVNATVMRRSDVV